MPKHIRVVHDEVRLPARHKVVLCLLYRSKSALNVCRSGSRRFRRPSVAHTQAEGAEGKGGGRAGPRASQCVCWTCVMMGVLVILCRSVLCAVQA